MSVTASNTLTSSLDRLPSKLQDYCKASIEELGTLHALASDCRMLGLDPSPQVDSGVAFDLAERVRHLMGLQVDERLRELLESQTRERAAVTLSQEVALGKFGFFERTESLDKAVRVGVAVLTEGVTVAPIQGISRTKIKSNGDGTNYAAVYFAGPMRSAGGTEAALTLVIADQVRRVLGLDTYRVNTTGEDEVGRTLEELRIYEREVSNLQFRVSDDDVRYALEHLPVEVDGVETDPVEVVVHRGLSRIETDRVRGGGLRVLNDGVIGRARKLLKVVRDLSLPEWEWLSELHGGSQQTSEDAGEKASHFREVISGRPVLSFPKTQGGFRLRYGRAPNTGLSAVGFHPATSVLLDYAFVAGTQVKIDMPGKAAIAGLVDSIEPPTIKLTDGSVHRVETVDQALALRSRLEKILYLGDMLISFGDFLENNTPLRPSAYVEEIWTQDLRRSIEDKGLNEASRITGLSSERLESHARTWQTASPSAQDAFTISRALGIPLHPRHTYYWDYLSVPQVLSLKEAMTVREVSSGTATLAFHTNGGVKELLETIGVPHRLLEEEILVEGEVGFALGETLAWSTKPALIQAWRDVFDLLSTLARTQILRKTSVSVGVRIGRPEKATARKMKPPVHSLFPAGAQAGIMRDILEAASQDSFEAELANMHCTECNALSLSSRCDICGAPTQIIMKCPRCSKVLESPKCPTCRANASPYSKVSYPLSEYLSRASSKVGYRAQHPFKGVRGLTNPSKVCERLEKGLLRQKYDLSVFKDGTIRFDATNAPLTHFTPAQTATPIERLKALGYTHDITDAPLESDDQLLELFMQDVILPAEAGEHLLRVSWFVDGLLAKLYGKERFYNATTKEDLIGRSIAGLAPHTSVAVIGRILGFSRVQACLAHPYWHSAKRRDCDGDSDSVMLLMDVLLNFSKDFLPGQIGGLMDAPLLIQPIILPKETQRQAHNFDTARVYPKEFYDQTHEGAPPGKLSHLIETVRDRLKDDSQFSGLGFTHSTHCLSVPHPRSSYTATGTLEEKLEKQIELAKKIRAVDVDTVVTSVLTTHLLPDILGNMKAYASQRFRCGACGRRFRRIPLTSKCLSCGGELRDTVTKGSVEKYLNLVVNLSERFNIPTYLKERIGIMLNEFRNLFPETGLHQTDLTSFLEEQT